MSPASLCMLAVIQVLDLLRVLAGPGAAQRLIENGPVGQLAK